MKHFCDLVVLKYKWKLVSSICITFSSLTASHVGLPDEKGRLEILQIHTSKMREHKKLSDDVDLEELANKTRNYSGAELEGLVRSATATAMNRIIKVS